MKAILIPANSSDPVKQINFDHDKSWRYVVTRYNDPDAPAYDLTEVAFLTKENAARDEVFRNSRASEYLRNHSYASESPKDLYGDVVVLGYDDLLERPTDLPWPHSPEDFEDLLTRIVEPAEPELTEVEIDELIADWERDHPPGDPHPPAPQERGYAPPYDLGGAPELYPYQ
jgi:hypothetical protein